MLAELQRARQLVVDVARAVGNGSVIHGGDAERLLAETVRLERAAAALRLTLQRRAAASGAAKRAGDPSNAAWLARTTGTTLGEAARSLQASDDLAGAEETRNNLLDGNVSPSQAATIAGAAAADPDAEARLNRSAARSSSAELARQASAAIAAARARQADDRRAVHESRFLRTWSTSDGAYHGRFKVTGDAGAVIAAAIRAARDDVFRQARAEGRTERSDALDADALVHALRTAGCGDGSGPTSTVHVHLSAEAASRGATRPGERCDIDDVGPVDIGTALRHLEDAAVEHVTDSPDGQPADARPGGRTVPTRIRRLLEARDPTCVVPGCGRRHHLEIHHLQPFAAGGPTTLDNLARICTHHHDQITYNGATLTGPHPDWAWHPPGSGPPPPSGCNPDPPPPTGPPDATDPTPPAGAADRAGAPSPPNRRREPPGLFDPGQPSRSGP